MLNQLVRARGRRRFVGIIQEDHEDKYCPEGLEGCKGHPVVIDWPDMSMTEVCTEGLKWMPRKKVWRIM
jgi:hypothetical protein